MKVYVIEVGCYSDRYIYGVTEDEDIAKEIVDRMKKSGEYYAQDASYSEYDTDLIISAKKMLYEVIFFGNEIEDLDLVSTDCIGKTFNFDIGYDVDSISDKSYMRINLFAINKEAAKKAAYDIRAKYLAEKAGI